MNDKITFPRLASMLADRSGKSKRFSEDFLREFFSLICEALESGECVKVKQLGTFRLSRVEARKSVDVTTGQAMEIAGHSKVVFIPSKELAEAVNAPFEAFTPIEISDDVDLNSIFPQDELNSCDSSSTDIPTSVANDNISTHSDLSSAFIEIEEETEADEDKADEDNDKFEYETNVDDGNIDDETSTDEDFLDRKEEEVAIGKDKEYVEAGAKDDTASEYIETKTIINQADPTDNTLSPHEETADNLKEDEEIPVESPRINWKRTLLILLGAAVIALVSTFAVWYIFFAEKIDQPSDQEAISTINLHTESDETENTYQTSAYSPTSPAMDSSDILQEPEAEVPTTPSDALVYDTIGDTRYLTTMAKAHYGNYNFWPYIYEENKSMLGHPDRIRPGTPIVIPKLSKYGVDPSKNEDIEKAKQLGVEIYARYGKKI
ncbi:MAG: HU family DNA-binding protein [Muribaculaceae bacterium]|nr:HU family DNA-binding protein [Muribaculaceae bacterium]